MLPYINIHTHQPSENADVISIFNWFTATVEQRYKLKLYAAGIHPWFIDDVNCELQFQQILEAAQDAKCNAIGECGLDKLKGPALTIQKELFIRHIALAIMVNKPVIVHCVHAFDVLSGIIKKYQGKVIFVIHGFNQNEQTAMQLLKSGAYLSFGAALLNEKQLKLKAIFSETPNNRIFLENDASEIRIEQIFEVAATIKKCDVSMMKEVIFANYKTVFSNE